MSQFAQFTMAIYAIYVTVISSSIILSLAIVAVAGSLIETFIEIIYPPYQRRQTQETISSPSAMELGILKEEDLITRPKRALWRYRAPSTLFLKKHLNI
jgi:hypothetical protein